MRNSWRLSPLVAVFVTAVGSWPVAGSCAVPPLGDHLALADAVFVGEVVELSSAGRTALVNVDEIWHGPALDTTVTVHGGPDDANAASPVDRTYVAGVTYLFAVTVSDGLLRDNSCSATREWTADLADLRPSNVATPSPTSQADGAGAVPLGPIAVGIAVLLVLATSLLAFQTRR